jgi:predicted ATPase
MARRRIVLTGAPGAGKTAVLELARRHFRGRLDVLHEAASIVFTGGFPRRPEPHARAAAQRAIFHVQAQLERCAVDTPNDDKAILCDRGTLDGLAYWPLARESFFAEVGTSLTTELARYDTVIHLRTPPRGSGYKDAVRNEDAAMAETIDELLLDVWSAHPKRLVVDNATSFMEKARRALAILDELVP